MYYLVDMILPCLLTSGITVLYDIHVVLHLELLATAADKPDIYMVCDDGLGG